MGPVTVLFGVQLMALLELALGRHPYALHSEPNAHVITRSLYLSGRAVESWTPCSDVAPWEVTVLEEGDRLPARGSSRIVYTDEARKWPDRTVPYMIDTLAFEEEQVEIIENVIKDMNGWKCVLLRPATPDDKNYLRITGRKEGCYAEHWGFKGGEQQANMQPPNCLRVGTVYHLIFHVLGFCHVHNSPRRDEFVRIKFFNVQKGKDTYLVKYPNDSRLTDFSMRYDYDSVMHCSRRIYSRNNRDTVETVDEYADIGQRDGPSPLDISKLRVLYDCPYEGGWPEITTPTSTPEPPSTLPST